MTWEGEMTESKHPDRTVPETSAPAAKKLSPAARRALAEAETRRANYLAKEAENPIERDGRGGKDPARYGDWEVKGRAIDF